MVYGWGEVSSINTIRETFKVVFDRTHKKLKYCRNGRLAPIFEVGIFEAQQSLFWAPFDICPSLAALTEPIRTVTKWRWVVQSSDYGITDDYYELASDVYADMPSVRKVLNPILSSAREFNKYDDE